MTAASGRGAVSISTVSSDIGIAYKIFGKTH
jgi:hypothetical protein